MGEARPGLKYGKYLGAWLDWRAVWHSCYRERGGWVHAKTEQIRKRICRNRSVGNLGGELQVRKMIKVTNDSQPKQTVQAMALQSTAHWFFPTVLIWEKAIFESKLIVLLLSNSIARLRNGYFNQTYVMRLTGASLPDSYPCLPLPPKRKKKTLCRTKTIIQASGNAKQPESFPRLHIF